MLEKLLRLLRPQVLGQIHTQERAKTNLGGVGGVGVVDSGEMR